VVNTTSRNRSYRVDLTVGLCGHASTVLTERPGAQDQPDFGTLCVTFYPSETVIELKSLKEYRTSGAILPCPDSRG
jgi:QueF-like protein